MGVTTEATSQGCWHRVTFHQQALWVFGGKIQSEGWSLRGSQHTPRPAGKVAFPAQSLALRFAPSKHTLRGLQLPGAVPAKQHGTLAPCFCCWPLEGRCGELCVSVLPADAKLGKQGSLHIDRQSWPRLLTRKQSNKQVPDHQPGSLYKHQHKPFGKCTNSLKNACILSPVIPSL